MGIGASNEERAAELPRNAHYGCMEVGERTYEFVRTKGQFSVRFTKSDGSRLKVRLEAVPNDGNYRWLPRDIYYIHSHGNRRVKSFGPFFTDTFVDAITSNKLTQMLKSYEK